MDRGRTTQLLHQAKMGDESALNELYQRIGARLLMLVRLRLGPSLREKVEPEDVAQEVLVKACSKIQAFEQDTSRSFFAWLAVIAGNTIRDLVDYHRQARRDMRRTVSTGKVSPDIAAKHRSALSRLILDERLQQLEQGLRSLNRRYREIIILRRLEEHSFKEIAAITGDSEDACRMRYTRALAVLTLNMKKRGC